MKRFRMSLVVAIVLGLLSVIGSAPVAAAPVLGGQVYYAGNTGQITVDVQYAVANLDSSLYLYPNYTDGNPDVSGKIFITDNCNVSPTYCDSLPTVTVSIPASIQFGDELVFGIEVQGTGNRFLIGPGSRNPDGIPHAAVETLAGGDVQVGFEDIYGGGDRDYDDNTFHFTSVVINHPPASDAGGPYSGVEGSPIAIGGTASDTDGDTLTASWSYDNTGVANGATCAIADPAQLNTTITCNDNGVFGLTLSVSDGENTVTSDTTVTVANVAPELSAITGAPTDPIPVGTSINLAADFIDAGTNDTHTAEWNWGDGMMAAGTVSQGAGSVSDSHTYTAKGTYVVTLTVVDDDGGSDTVSATIVVANRPPSADAGGPYSGNEGAPIALTGSGADLDPGDSLTYTWTYVAGAGTDAGASCSFADASSPSTTITCDDDGEFTATLSVSDGEDTTQSDALVTVANVAPVLDAITGAPIDPIPVGTPLNLAADFTDAGANDTHTAEWDWGDGVTAGSVTQGAGFGSVADSHTYGTAGVYTITLTVTDDDGGSDTATVTVVVYDPSAGFVTGGGWIESPAGAYVVDPSVGGKATFGFVAKYKKGATVPDGNTEFQFHAGNLNFKSSSYQWLVVAGNNAQFKGVGTINGQGNYGFLLTASDGSPDTFRIKIWDIDNGDALVYDNGSNQDLGAGSIVIHSK